MKKVLLLIDSHDYIETNCFQHQLYASFKSLIDHDIFSVQIHELNNLSIKIHEFDCIVSCLKQRTLLKHIDKIKLFLKNSPIVIYDQDPWEAFRDGSPYKGSYDYITKKINVKTFAVTTKWWADFLQEKNMNSTFVRMSILPDYCNSLPEFNIRNIQNGFIGKNHSYREKLFFNLKDLNVNVDVQTGFKNYSDYLKGLSQIQFFIHSEDYQFTVDGIETNLNVGLWVKDVEAAGRGCFSIRSRGVGSETYLDKIKTVLLYDHISEIPMIINQIIGMESKTRQDLINETVATIRDSNEWGKTVEILTKN